MKKISHVVYLHKVSCHNWQSEGPDALANPKKGIYTFCRLGRKLLLIAKSPPKYCQCFKFKLFSKIFFLN